MRTQTQAGVKLRKPWASQFSENADPWFRDGTFPDPESQIAGLSSKSGVQIWYLPTSNQKRYDKKILLFSKSIIFIDKLISQIFLHGGSILIPLQLPMASLCSSTFSIKF